MSAAFFYAVMLISIFEPWLDNFVGQNFTMAQMIWAVLIITISIIFSKRLEIMKKKKRFIYISFYIAINFIILLILSWSFEFYSVLFLLFFYLSMRYTLYGKVINNKDRGFNKDFTVFLIIMLASVYYSSVGKLDLSYINIIIFFGSAISLSIYFNFESIDKIKKQRLITTTASIYIITASIITFLVYYGQNIMNKIATQIIELYYTAVDFFMVFFKYILIAITPLVKLYQKIVMWLFVGGEAPPDREKTPIFEYIQMIEDMRKSPVKDFNPPFWIIYILLAIFIILISIQLIRISLKSDKKGMREERKSLLTADQLKDDISELFSFVKKPFRKNKKIYDRSSDIIIIREIYYNFLIKYTK